MVTNWWAKLTLIILLVSIFSQLPTTSIIATFLKECFLLVFCGAEKWDVCSLSGDSPDKQGGLYISTFFWFLVKLVIANVENIDSSEVVIANGVRFLVGVNMYLIRKKSQISEEGWNLAYMDMYSFSTEKGNTLADIPEVLEFMLRFHGLAIDRPTF